MRIMPREIGAIHFIGIGGIGMSGIADVLHDLGYAVQGSDLSENLNVKRLRDKGIVIHKGHDAANLVLTGDDVVSVVVVSSAINKDNAELMAAKEAGLPVVRRAEMLAELMRLKWSVAIGGTHGKTTTTSMVGAMLEEGGYDPTVINGGIVNRYGTNTRLGKSDWMVVEADESDGTFTRLPATVSVVTNIDPEHMENYGSFDEVRKAYRQFVENIPFYGFAVVCSDHPEVQSLISDVQDRRIISYGFNPQADIRGTNLRVDVDGSHFDVVVADWLNDGQEAVIKDVYLSMPGEHNVQNALSSIAIAQEMGIGQALIKKALSEFSGVKRRFTKTGTVDGITVIDDYGHHPVEIAAVLRTARKSVEKEHGRVIAVIQPHRYSRLHSLFEDFCTCAHDADTVIISDVYAAGETPIEGADRDAYVKGLTRHGHRDVRSLESEKDLAAMVSGLAKSGDIVVCLGAGNITNWACNLPDQMRELQNSAQNNPQEKKQNG